MVRIEVNDMDVHGWHGFLENNSSDVARRLAEDSEHYLPRKTFQIFRFFRFSFVDCTFDLGFTIDAAIAKKGIILTQSRKDRKEGTGTAAAGWETC